MLGYQMIDAGTGHFPSSELGRGVEDRARSGVTGIALILRKFLRKFLLESS